MPTRSGRRGQWRQTGGGSRVTRGTPALAKKHLAHRQRVGLQERTSDAEGREGVNLSLDTIGGGNDQELCGAEKKTLCKDIAINCMPKTASSEGDLGDVLEK